MRNTNWYHLLFAMLIVQYTVAQIPQTMSYQGRLTDAGGNPVANGNYSLVFKLYDVSTAGVALWTETQGSVPVSGGIFNVILGSVTPFGLGFDKPYWLGVSVQGGAELSPRTALTSSPYSMSASGVVGGSNIFPAGGNVGIGTTSPAAFLHMKGPHISNRGQLTIESSELPQLTFYSGPTTTTDLKSAIYYDLAGLFILNNYNGGSYGPIVLNPTSGNVGIGTTAPGDKLDITGGAMRVGGANGTFRAHPFFGLFNNTTLLGTFDGLSSGAQLRFEGPGNGFMDIGQDGLGNFVVERSDVPALVVDTTGNVGIGTTSPKKLLDLSGQGAVFRTAGVGSPRTAPFFSIDADAYSTDQGILSIVDRRFQTALSLTPTLFVENSNASTVSQNLLIQAVAAGATRFAVRHDGNVGIGTTSPQSLEHLYNTNTSSTASQLTIEANSNFGSKTYSAIEFRANAASAGVGPSGRIVTSYPSGAYVDATMTLQTIGPGPAFVDAMSLKGGNVGIGTTSPAAKLDVAGYAKLGSVAPAIQMKKLTGTTYAYEGGTVSISHGIDDSKIISIDVMVEYDASSYLHAGYTNNSGYEFNWYSVSGSVTVWNTSANSANILSKPIKILITYEQ